MANAIGSFEQQHNQGSDPGHETQSQTKQDHVNAVVEHLEGRADKGMGFPDLIIGISGRTDETAIGTYEQLERGHFPVVAQSQASGALLPKIAQEYIRGTQPNRVVILDDEGVEGVSAAAIAGQVTELVPGPSEISVVYDTITGPLGSLATHQVRVESIH